MSQPSANALPASSAPEDFRMSLFDHLAELRTRLLRVTLSVLALGAIGLVFARPLYGLLMRPVLLSLPQEAASFVYTSAIEEINVLMKMGLYCGVFLSTPVLLFQIWGFVAPGLYDEEKKYAGPFILAGTLAFLAGTAFCYFVVLPSMFQFLLQKEEVVQVQRRLELAQLRESDALRWVRLGDFDRAGATARGAIGDLEAPGEGQTTDGPLGITLTPKDSVDVKLRLEGLGRLLDAALARAPSPAPAALGEAVGKREDAVKAYGAGRFGDAKDLADAAGALLAGLDATRTQDWADLWKLEKLLGVGSAQAEAQNWTKPMLSMSEQLSLVLVLELAFGVIFELPLVMMVLGLVGLVSSSFLFKYQRHAFVLCLVLAAVITPTGDAVNLALMGGPMMACYELGVLLVWLVERRRKRAQATPA